MAARAYSWRATNGWTANLAARQTQSEAAAAGLGGRRRWDGTTRLRSRPRAARSRLGYVVGEVDAGTAPSIDRAVRASIRTWPARGRASGWARMLPRRSRTSRSRTPTRAMRLSSLDPHTISMQGGMAFAHFIAGRDDEALFWAEKAWACNPTWLRSKSCRPATPSPEGSRRRKTRWHACAI